MILAIEMIIGEFDVDLREHVVNNVVLDDAVEDMAANEAEFTVNS